jgi:hypothetical protein
MLIKLLAGRKVIIAKAYDLEEKEVSRQCRQKRLILAKAFAPI